MKSGRMMLLQMWWGPAPHTSPFLLTAASFSLSCWGVVPSPVPTGHTRSPLPRHSPFSGNRGFWSGSEHRKTENSAPRQALPFSPNFHRDIVLEIKPVRWCVQDTVPARKILPHIPNVLRAMIVEYSDDPAPGDVDLLETNVDDVSAEILAYTFSRLIEEGAYDVSALPCTMKKGRPGHLIRVVAGSGEGERLAAVMAEELGTLGVRSVPAVHRFIAERSIREIPVTIQGEERNVRVKCGVLHGRVISLKAEYDDVSAWAQDLRMPARTVARIIESQAWDLSREVSIMAVAERLSTGEPAFDDILGGGLEPRVITQLIRRACQRQECPLRRGLRFLPGSRKRGHLHRY